MNDYDRIDQAIKQLHRQGFTYQQIKSTLHIGSDRIHRVLTGTPKVRRGRPKKTNEDIISFVDANTMADPYISNEDMATKIKSSLNTTVSTRTVSNIRTDLKYHFRPKYKIQELTENQKIQRINFTQYASENLLNEKIIFSDEARSSPTPDNRWCYIKKGQWNEACFETHKKFYQSVMVWGCIGENYKSRLFLCSNNMDAAEYISILNNSQIVPQCNQLYQRNGWMFQQEGAPCHTAQETLSFLRSIRVVPGWPANSPDLNPIEMVWAIIKRRLKTMTISSRQDLILTIFDIWNNIEMEVINSLVQDFGRRIELCRQVNGCSISQYLSSHQTQTKNLPSEQITQHLFSEEEDQMLIQYLLNQNPRSRQWKQCQSTNFPWANVNILKYRVNMLSRDKRNHELAQMIELPSIEEILDLIE